MNRDAAGDLFYCLAWDEPYDDYRQLSDLGPVRRLDETTLLVTGFDACSELMRSRQASNDLRTGRTATGEPVGLYPELDRFDSFLYRDAPEHERIRHVVVRAMRDFDVDASRQHAYDGAAHLLAQARQRGSTWEPVSAVAQVLPGRLSQHMFGIAADDLPDVARWARDITLGLEPRMTGAMVRRRVLSILDFAAFLERLVESHRTDPRGDLLDMLIAAGEEDGDLVGDELTATVMLFLAALFGSTVDMVGNLFAVVARWPEEYLKVRDDPSLVPSAVEELFRFESPFQLIYRTALAGLSLGGRAVPVGTRVTLALGVANRDAEQFDRPDQYVADRSGERHMAFGGTIHNCVGVAYSRVWAQSVLTAMTEQVVSLTPAGAFPARTARAFRGYREVPVVTEWTASAAAR